MPSKCDYKISVSGLQWRLPLSLALVLTAGGCMVMPVSLGDLPATVPATSGSSEAAWPLPLAMPASLDPSDAMAIAEAVRRELAGSRREQAPEWQNPVTGSVGDLIAVGAPEAVSDTTCRTYTSTVHSIKGAHLYTARACRTPDGQVTVEAIETGEARIAAAGI